MKSIINKKHGPWVIKRTEVKYQNPWMKVSEDSVLRPDGQPGIFGTVKIKPGISVLPIDKDGFVYLTKEFHYAIGQEDVEVVSGGIEDGETLLETAKRELQEEVGIMAKTWIDLGIVNPFTTMVYSPAQLYLAKDITFTERNLESTEVIIVFKVQFQEAVQMVLESKITHGPSCVLILKAKEYLAKEDVTKKT